MMPLFIIALRVFFANFALIVTQDIQSWPSSSSNFTNCKSKSHQSWGYFQPLCLRLITQFCHHFVIDILSWHPWHLSTVRISVSKHKIDFYKCNFSLCSSIYQWPLYGWTLVNEHRISVLQLTSRSLNAWRSNQLFWS